MARRSIWVRWAGRDLRAHFGGVLAIAAVIAIGTGVYAGLGSTAQWRRLSNDASFAATRMHDLRVELGAGTFADDGELSALAATLPHASWIDSAQERLVVATTIDASTGGDTILVAARLIGAEYDGQAIDDAWVARGDAAGLRASGDDAPAAVLEMKFAEYYRLPDHGTVTLSGGTPVRYTGVGVGPEQFYVSGPEGSILAHADLANLFAHLSTVQRLSDRPGEINDLVLRLTPGADRDVLEAELDAAFATRWSATVTTREETEAYRVLYEDIDNDQQIWNALSGLVLGAAALASFNLISRIAEAQRREIGIGMALGVPRRRLAIRPIAVGSQVGVLGTLAGIGVAVLVGAPMRDLLRSRIPMPIWETPFQASVFLRGAVLGIVPPLLASVLPVWRALRVEPIEAIRTGHLARASGRLGSWARRVRLPGSSTAQLPLRNLLRAPRRSVLTAVGIGAAITALVAVLGLLDSFERAIGRGSDELTRGDPERVVVVLDGFHPVTSKVVAAIADHDVVGRAEPTLRVPGAVRTQERGELAIDLVVELLPLDDASDSVWSPTVTAGSGSGGLVLAEKAARDLGVVPGDEVVLAHPQRSGLGFSMVEESITVAGTHPNPIRNFAFLDASYSAQFGIDGFANVMQVVPSAGHDRSDVQRAMFGVDSVASAQPVARLGEAFDEALELFVGMLVITAGAVLILALLIALNSTRISIDERRREHATMLAFGLGVRRVVGIVGKEAIAIGLLATGLGIVAGTGVVQWMLASLAERTLPDMDIARYLSPTTYVVAAIVGVLSVSLAPLLLTRRIARMDLPDTLRVME